nr:NADH-quinone oxidoreductase subunit A [Neoasaia chiangmaiensis]
MSQFISDHALAIYIVFTAVFLCIVVALSAVLGPRRVGAARGRSMSLPYESGILQTGSARVRLPVQYYLVAMFFVIFDVESVFLYAWGSVAVKAGWAAYISVLTFIVFLCIALAYLWRSGALEWGPKHRKMPPRKSFDVSEHEV